MTEYWVSQQRHWCKYCQIWCSGDKGSVKHHESGGKHRYNVRNFLKNAQREKVDEQKESEALQRELQRIQQAAEQSFQKDLRAQQAAVLGHAPAPTSSKTSGNRGRAEHSSGTFPFARSEHPPISAPRSAAPPPLPPALAAPNPAPHAPLPPDSGIKFPPPPPVPPAPEPAASGEADAGAGGSISDFKEFYKKFYAEFKKDPTADPSAIAESVKQTEKEEKEPEEDTGGNPYGEWEEVDVEEEAARNAPVTLVEDEFTRANPYAQRRKPQVENDDSEEEEVDSTLSALESKDDSVRSLYGDSDDEEAPTTSVVFKKRSRKKDKSKGNARKRQAVTRFED